MAVHVPRLSLFSWKYLCSLSEPSLSSPYAKRRDRLPSCRRRAAAVDWPLVLVYRRLIRLFGERLVEMSRPLTPRKSYISVVVTMTLFHFPQCNHWCVRPRPQVVVHPGLGKVATSRGFEYGRSRPRHRGCWPDARGDIAVIK